MKSILEDNDKCYICGSTYLMHEHHVYFGKNRKLSEKYGLKCKLCSKHHKGSNEGVHEKDGHENDMKLKREFQVLFEKIHGPEKFMEVFMKNYL